MRHGCLRRRAIAHRQRAATGEVEVGVGWGLSVGSVGTWAATGRERRKQPRRPPIQASASFLQRMSARIQRALAFAQREREREEREREREFIRK